MMKRTAAPVITVDHGVDIRRVASRVLADGSIKLTLDVILQHNGATGVRPTRRPPGTTTEVGEFLRWLGTKQIPVRAALAKDLYAAYKQWAAEEQRRALSLNFFISALRNDVGACSERRRYEVSGTVVGPHAVIFLGGAENTFCDDRPGLSTQIARARELLAGIQSQRQLGANS